MLSIEDFKSPLFESQNSAIDGSWAPGERERWETVTSGFAYFDLSEEAIPMMREAIKPDPGSRSAEEQEVIERCTLEVLSFDSSRYEALDGSEMEVRVHLPPSISSTGEGAVLKKGIIYFHGGAFIFGNAADFDYQASLKAVTCDSVVFNVDYRSAPEVKAPKGILDCIAAVHFIFEELLARFNVDLKRLCLNGESSGGYLAVGTAMELAKTGEADRIKLLVPDVPAISAHWITPDDGSPTHWSRNEVMKASGDGGHLETVKMLCHDWKQQFSDLDPYVFPGEMPDEVLKKLPACVILTNEHCFLRKDAELFASRLLAHDKLLDYCVRPGTSHYSDIPGLSSDKSSIFSQVLETYL